MYLVIVEMWNGKNKYYVPIVDSESRGGNMAEFETMEEIRELKRKHVLKRTLWYAFKPLHLKAWEIV